MAAKNKSTINAGETQRLFDEALRRHGAGRADEALSLYKKILKTNPAHGGALYHCAIALWQSGKAREALPCIRKALGQRPGDPAVHNTAGLIWTTLEDFPHAEESFRAALELKPDYAEVYFNLARLFSMQASWEKGLMAVEKLLSLRPDHKMGRILKLSMLAELGRFEDIGEDADAAFLQMPGNPYVLYLKGQMNFRRGFAAQAIRDYDAALALDPRYRLALQGKATALAESDDKAGAEESLLKLLEADPLNVSAMRLLTNIRKCAPGDSIHASLMRARKEEDRFTPSQKADFYYAFAKYCADTGDDEGAFSFWEKGAAAKFSSVSYDFEKEKKRHARIIDLFPRKLSWQIETENSGGAVPVFILGMPRSGTTLMEQILSSHPQITAGGEQKFLRNALGHAGDYEGIGENPAAKEAVFKKAAERYLSALSALAPESRFITDKMPHNYAYLGFIFTMLPQAKIVHMVRNPLDTCLSCFSLLFSSGHEWSYDLRELGRFYRLYSETMDHWRAVMPEGSFLEVRYEDLVADMEGQTKRVLAYCGLPWDDACLSFYENRRVVGTASTHQVRRPLYQSSIGRWRQYESRLKPLLAEIRPVAEKLGYEV